tara:strand:+ start:678 stop:1379 length:702 start_codon:yes stop_codon:yes gene_type:complete
MKMAELEFGGAKFTGGKMFAVITALSTLGGGLWGGFEFYKDYMDMKEAIQEYVAPDMSGLDKAIAVQSAHQENVEAHMTFVEKELQLFKDEFDNVRGRILENQNMTRDTKHDLKDELVRAEKHLDRVEDEVRKVEEENRALAVMLMGEVRSLMDEGEKEQDKLKREVQNQVEIMRGDSDRLKSDVRAMIDDANNRFNDKISGLEGYVKRELGALEDKLMNTITKALDNPLANR